MYHVMLYAVMLNPLTPTVATRVQL